MSEFKRSKLTFTRIFAKNFRSIDNTGMELIYQEGSTLVGSLDNGAGKSTMLVHALYYALFDKPYGKGNTKSGMINSRSGKDCVVELEFIANGSAWKVVRGMKPTLFDIFKDGVRIIDEASLKVYASNIEKVIGFDEKVFNNTIALGHDKFVPFTNMPAGDRRNYCEQMLDLLVFSQMNTVNKVELKDLQTELSKNTNELNGLNLRLAGVERVIEVKKQNTGEKIDALNVRLAEAGITKENALEWGTEAKTRYDAIKLDADQVKVKVDAKNKYASTLTLFKNQISELKSSIEREENGIINTITRIQDKWAVQQGYKFTRQAFSDTCPTCGQSTHNEAARINFEAAQDALEATHANTLKINEAVYKSSTETQNSVLAVTREKYNEVATKTVSLNVATEKYNAMEDCTAEANTINQKLMQAQSDINVNQSNYNQAETSIRNLKAEIENISKDIGWDEELLEVERHKAGIVQFSFTIDNCNILINHRKILEASLKDDGAKSNIINLYIPFLNEKINEYLGKMNFFVSINLTNEFEIELSSPDRKGQSINSLSTGQQKRIDLAVLLAWRDVARLSASCDTNLLILDEILENLSSQGVETFLEMWNNLDQAEGVNLYVVTQRLAEFDPMFEQSIIYRLIDDATQVYSVN